MRFESPSRRVSFVFVALLVSLALPAKPSSAGNSRAAWASASPLTTGLAASFKWSMPKRFGPKNADGLVDYHWNEGTKIYDPAYVNPASWMVDFDACTPAAVPGSTFEWQIDGQAQPNPNPTACKFSHPFTAQKTYPVKLTMTAPDGQISIAETDVTVKDLLIVSIGDSFASGQGNPDIQKKGSTPAKWVDKVCARSANAGPAQAALSIEQADAHTSVTFISFACTGAEITAGLIGTQVRGSTTLAPQIEKVREAVSKRGRIDALMISVGGNDAGFADLVARCILQFDCSTDQGTQEKLQTGLATLQPRYLALNDKIKSLQPITIMKVFITEYGDLVRDENGEVCHRSPPFDLLVGIRTKEARWASESVIRQGLNARVKVAADAFGWTYVGGIADKFVNHGYCSKERWVRTFTEAKHLQGTDNKCTAHSFTSFGGIKDCIISSGSVHPNVGGHAWYASRLIEELQNAGVTTPVGP